MCIGSFGFFIASSAMSIGYVIGTVTGTFYDWYLLRFMKTLKYIKQQIE
jgi:hypothetical protein